jgi:uncharacterized protein (TIGR04255 family)
MPFPDSPRIIYNKNPLTEVICQLSFPAILRIDSEIPANFQSKIQENYPIYQEAQGANLKLNFPQELAQVVGNTLSLKSGRASYQFLSGDRKWKVTLTREFLSVSTKEYTRWEDFKQHLEIALEAFIEEYKPLFFTRIGLRYQDLIQRSKLDLENVSWSELLSPPIAGELSAPEIVDKITHCVNQLTITLDENGSMVLLNHGLVSNENSEDLYIIDSDFLTEQKTEVQNVIEKLNYFNKFSGRLFRWCISEKLHNALEPQPV